MDDRELLAAQERWARRYLERHGDADVAKVAATAARLRLRDRLFELERDGGATNTVFMGSKFVLKVSRDPGSKALMHEWECSLGLNDDVLYPEILAGDVQPDLGVCWILQRRVDGVPLTRAWQEAAPGRQLTRMLEQMCAQVEAIHASKPENPWPAWPPSSPPWWQGSWFSGVLLDTFDRDLIVLTTRNVITEEFGDRLMVQHDLLSRESGFRITPPYDAERFGPLKKPVPSHGDCHLGQFLWLPDTERITATLDLETAFRGPVDFDWYHLLRSATHFNRAFCVHDGNEHLLRKMFDPPAAKALSMELLHLVRIVRGLAHLVDVRRPDLAGRALRRHPQVRSAITTLDDLGSGRSAFRDLARELIRRDGVEIPDVLESRDPPSIDDFCRDALRPLPFARPAG